jgi:chemotaxis protein MotB
MAKKSGGSHGGAWKVAYADFVTAMMALFMVLWITSQDKEILLATSQYFKKPFTALTDKSVGVMQGKDGGSQGKDKNRETATAANLAFLNALSKELNRALNVNDVSQENPVELEVTSDGLKVTLFDRGAQPLFEKNTATFTAWGRFAIQNLAWLIERNRLRVVIDGHASRGAVLPSTKNYGLWELTSDRANSARRLLEFYAVPAQFIDRVVGYADTKPLPNFPKESESNQRITISLAVE